jgi:Putative Ig domain
VKTETRTQQVSLATSVSERVVKRDEKLPVVDDPDLVVPAGSVWALLSAVLEIGDNFGMPIVPSIGAGGLTDSKGRAIQYQASGLPARCAIDPSTGIISGAVDVSSAVEFLVVLSARASGSSKSIFKTFTLRIDVQ